MITNGGCRTRASIYVLAEAMPTASPYRDMLSTGLDAMHQRCDSQTGQNIPAAAPPPLPGGILQPRLDKPSVNFLAARVDRHFHRCATASATTAEINS